MRLNVMLEPQEGMTYAHILDVARRVEAVGLDGLFRSDHYTSVDGRDEHGSTDAWATLAGLVLWPLSLGVGPSLIRAGVLESGYVDSSSSAPFDR